MLGYAFWALLFLVALFNQGIPSALLFMLIYFVVTVAVALLITPFEAIVGNLFFLDWHHTWHGQSSLSPREVAGTERVGLDPVMDTNRKRAAQKIALGRAFGWVALTILAVWLSRLVHLNQTLQGLMAIALGGAVLISYLDKYGTGMARTWGEWALGLIGVFVGIVIAGGLF